jgi:hypothetical protein
LVFGPEAVAQAVDEARQKLSEKLP